MNCDHNLFLALNFDGGPFMDRLMLTVAVTAMWLPLYALILWLVWRRDGWRNVILFTALMIAALVLSDMISGIFKHNGVLGGLLPDFEPRGRPMFTPALEGLEIAPDSLRKLRWLTPDSLPPPGGPPVPPPTARIFVGILSHVIFLTTWVMMLVITVRIRAASRMADTARGMYCIMVSMFISSSVYFTAPPRAHSSRSREGNVL